MYTKTELQRKRAETVIAMTGYADTRGERGEKEVLALSHVLDFGIDIGIGIGIDLAAKAAEEKSAAPADKKEE